ncbi:MAG: hypothetical protein BGO78_11610 [Chloroflexi bacterium 44-23]|nr:MAG: hypothetical protein BGO78_11610 [Chloroflexi bacterium 44-23]
MKNDRFFNGILIGIAAIIVIAIAAFFIRQQSNKLMTDNSPAAAVNNYVVYLYQQDYEQAYKYLADLENKPLLAQFRQSFTSYNQDIGSVSIKLNETSQDANSATVYLTIIRQAGGLFSEPYRDSQPAQLILQNGEWKISNMPYPFWDYSWYQKPFDAQQK